jgi:hypothetical protein
MRFADLSRTVLRVQYQIARIPLQLLDEQLVARLDSDARLRLIYQRSLGLLDAVVGNVLGSPTLAQRGVAKIERTDKLMRAADLDAEANATIDQANSKLRDVRAAAAKATEDARAETGQAAKHAQDAADERKREARETADQRAAAAKKQADDSAAIRKGAADAAKRVQHNVIRAHEKLAEADAQAKLDDAQDNRGVATRKRARANRLADLADEEKAKRRSAQ